MGNSQAESSEIRRAELAPGGTPLLLERRLVSSGAGLFARLWLRHAHQQSGPAKSFRVCRTRSLPGVAAVEKRFAWYAHAEHLRRPHHHRLPDPPPPLNLWLDELF